MVACVPTPAGVLFVTQLGGSLLTKTGHWKNFGFWLRSSGDGMLLEAEETSDPDVVIALGAAKQWVRSGMRRSSHEVAWNAGKLVATGQRGLCLLRPESPYCATLMLPGVDGIATTVARDVTGRLWFAGSGIWFLDAAGRGIPVHSGLPFWTSTVARDMCVVDGQIALALGERGAAVLDWKRLVTSRE
jgi:hypothetical protein